MRQAWRWVERTYRLLPSRDVRGDCPLTVDVACFFHNQAPSEANLLSLWSWPHGGLLPACVGFGDFFVLEDP